MDSYHTEVGEEKEGSEHDEVDYSMGPQQCDEWLARVARGPGRLGLSHSYVQKGTNYPDENDSQQGVSTTQ